MRALQTDAISPVTADGNDLSVEFGLVEPPEAMLVIRKPTSNGPVHSLGRIPVDPAAAWQFLKDEFAVAAASGAAEILFPENASITLQNPDSASGAHLVVEGLQDVVIDFNGSSLTFLHAAPGIVISDAQRVVFRNGTLRSEILLSSIATTEADDSAAGRKFTLLPEFVEPLEDMFEASGDKPQVLTVGRAIADSGKWRFDAVDNNDLFVNRGGDNNLFAYKTEGAGASKSSFFEAVSAVTSGEIKSFMPGQLVYLLHQNNAGHAIVLKNDDGNVEDISFENLTLSNIPGMGITGDVNRGVHVKQVRIVPDASNPLSIWGSSSDAFHINNHGGDILFEDNDLGGSADDLFTAKGNWWKITQIDRKTNTIVVDNAGKKKYGVQLWGGEGDRVIAMDGSMRLLGEAVQAKRSEEGSGKQHTIHLQTIPDTFTVGTLVANPDRAGGRIVIRNNTFANSRAQGTLVQTRHVLVENNTFRNIAGPGVKLNFSPTEWYEAASVSNVWIKDNVFIQTGVAANKPQHNIYLRETDANESPIEIMSHLKLTGNTPESPDQERPSNTLSSVQPRPSICR